MSRKTLVGLLITLGVFLVVSLMSACSPATEPEPVPVSEPVVSIPAPVTPTPEPEPVEEPIIVESPEETQSMPSTGGLIEFELILLGLGATSLGTGIAIMRKRKK